MCFSSRLKRGALFVQLLELTPQNPLTCMPDHIYKIYFIARSHVSLEYIYRYVCVFIHVDHIVVSKLFSQWLTRKYFFLLFENAVGRFGIRLEGRGRPGGDQKALVGPYPQPPVHTRITFDLPDFCAPLNNTYYVLSISSPQCN